MKIIKECVQIMVNVDGIAKQGHRYIIRTNTYNRGLGHILMLVQQAKVDFDTFDSLEKRKPLDLHKDFDVVLYAGSFYAGTVGIEFVLAGEKHEEYELVNTLELRH